MKLSSVLSVSLAALALVSASCSSDNASTTNPFPVSDDVTPPSDVATFTAVAGVEAVTLSWTAATDDQGLSGYRVEMIAPDAIVRATINTSVVVDAATLTLTWTGLVEGVTYTFSVVAIDTSNNLSATAATISTSPFAPDETAPTDVPSVSGAGGYNDPVTENFVELTLGWAASASADVSHYLLCIGTSAGSCDILNNFNVGNITALTVPDDVSGPVSSGDLAAALAIGTDYFVQVITVDTSGNQSPGTSTTVTPTESFDTTPPGPVIDLEAVPDDQSVDLTWTPPADGDASLFSVYVRRIEDAGDDETVDWELFSQTSSFSLTVTEYLAAPLVNGAVYEFMVAGVDVSGNETTGASTAATDDDDATKVTAVPTSNTITAAPNFRGGVFREEFFATRNIVLTVATTEPAILTGDATTVLYYKINGSVDTTITAGDVDATTGRIEFSDAAVTEIEADRLYAVTIDFDPAAVGTQTVSENTLRPDGSADHIVVKYQIVTPTDASRVFTESYLIYQGLADDSFLKFSGTRLQRAFATLTGIESGNTDGDMIVVGGSTGPEDISGSRDTASRYRVQYEHFESINTQTLQNDMTRARSFHRATLLEDGETILVTGGKNVDQLTAPVDGAGNETLGLESTDLFSADVTDEGFTAAPADMDLSRSLHTATRLFNGRVLILGGLNGETTITGTIGAEEVAVPDPSGSDVTSTALYIDQTTLGASFDGVTFEGRVVEKIDGAGEVYDVGVITSQASTTSSDVTALTVAGLIFDNVPGDLFRVINEDTAVSEFFTAAGANDGVSPPSMTFPRYGHTATLLQDGTVFVAGGLVDYDGGDDARNDGLNEFITEIYDPQLNTFTALSIAAELDDTRFFHTATLLRDGKVLLTGGLDRGDYVYRFSGFSGGAEVRSSAYLYDPFTRTIEKLDATMVSSRFFHSATLMANGEVLIVGGYTAVSDEGVLTITESAEIYNPDSRTFRATNGNMNTLRGPCASQMIALDVENTSIAGKVLVVGGSQNTLAELYNPNTGQFEATAHSISGDRFVGTGAATLLDGNVLITGGQESTVNGNVGQFLNSAEIYDSSLVAFLPSDSTMANSRRHHTSTVLVDGTVLIAGGETRINDEGGEFVEAALDECEVYDPDEDTFTDVASMIQERYKHSATLLPDGRVFICGGQNTLGPLASCELYDPVTQAFSSVPNLEVGRFDHTATLLPNGWVLIAGGESIDDSSIEIFDPVAEDFLPALNVSNMNIGRDGHVATRPSYSIGRARFLNGSTTVIGSGAASTFGYEHTNWLAAGVRPGDVIVSENDNRPYVISTVAGSSLTLANFADFDYDDTGYSGVSTSEILTGNGSQNDFEYYVIYSQDAYFLGGEVTTTTTEVFDFDAGDDEWPAGGDPTDYVFNTDGAGDLNQGRYGQAVGLLGDFGLVLAGGTSDAGTGEHVNLTVEYEDDAWTLENLDPAGEPIEFPVGFRVQNNMVIFIHQHSARAFFHD